MSKTMKPPPLVLFLISSTLLAASCAYRGAVYSEFTTAGIDLRADATSGAPVRFVFGYDRGVGAYVPRRNSGTTDAQGEAVSVVSWSYLRTTPAPTPQNANRTAISVDAGFISGTAAQVIAAPAGFTVCIEEPATSGATANLCDTTVTGLFITQGDPGARIATAASVRTVEPDSQEVHARKKKLSECINKNIDNNKLKPLAKMLGVTPNEDSPIATARVITGRIDQLNSLELDSLEGSNELRSLCP